MATFVSQQRYFCSILYDTKKAGGTVKEYVNKLKDKIKSRKGDLPVKTDWQWGGKTVGDALSETMEQSKYLVILYSEGFSTTAWYEECESQIHKEKPRNLKTKPIVMGIQGFCDFPSSLQKLEPPVFKSVAEEERWDTLLEELEYNPKIDRFLSTGETIASQKANESKLKKIFRQNWEVLADQLSDISGVVDGLITKGVVEVDINEHLRAKVTRKDKARFLLEELNEKPDNDIKEFFECLKKGNKYLYEQINNQILTCGQTPTFAENQPTVDPTSQSTEGYPHQVSEQEEGVTEVTQRFAHLSTEDTQKAGPATSQDKGTKQEDDPPPTSSPVQAMDEDELQTEDQVDADTETTRPKSTNGIISLPKKPVKPTTLPEAEKKIVNLSGECILDELIDYVQKHRDERLSQNKYLYEEDGKGVESAHRQFQEVLVDFVHNWLTRYSEGVTEKAPIIRPQMNKAEYIATGLILRQGFEDVGYFPPHLCLASLIAAIHGDEKVSDDILIKSFYNFLTQEEAQVIEDALKADSLAKDVSKKVTSIFSQFKMRYKVTKANLHKNVISCAQFLLLSNTQVAFESMGMKAWAEFEHFSTPENILTFMASLQINGKKVRRMLQAGDTFNNEEEEAAFNDLKRFVGNLNPEMLRKFLRFSTGIDTVFEGSKITVFINENDEERSLWFYSRTCASTLWIPTCHVTYNDFVDAFTEALNFDTPYASSRAKVISEYEKKLAS